ncbi:lipase family protein [Actinomadura rubteroloni]|nr:lipase family protein [Actinomadura rubteroloni]
MTKGSMSMSTSLRRVVRSVLGSCVGVAIAATALQGTAQAAPADVTPPAQDAFYTPPSPLPQGKPGDVIRSRQSQYPTFGDAKAWQVLYRSESATGEPIAVSGTVVVPTKAWTGGGKRPLVTWGVGTRGLGDACAPSYTLATGLDYEALFVADALSRGWAVAITDMQGLGTPGQHTYEVGQSQGRAVLNIARAAERLDETGLGADAPVGIMGYSQGGTSAGWAAQLAGTYAPDLQVKGTAAGGVPADLLAVAKSLDQGPFAALMYMAAVGYDAAYPELNLQKYLNDAGKKLLADTKDLCLVSVDVLPALFNTAFKKISDFTTTNPLDQPDWQARLKENRLGGTAPSAPVFQAQAVFDEIIPFQQADTLHKEWCAKGANVTWKTYLFAEHALGMVQSEPDSMAFLADRFAGKPAQGNCAA